MMLASSPPCTPCSVAHSSPVSGWKARPIWFRWPIVQISGWWSGSPTKGLSSGAVPSSFSRSSFPKWVPGSWAYSPVPANSNAPPTVMNSLLSGPQISRDAAMPPPQPSATKMSRTSVSAPAPTSRRPRASATVAPCRPSRSSAFE